MEIFAARTGETGLLIADGYNQSVALPESYTSFDDGGGIYGKIIFPNGR
jgi:hypothetical protein